MTDEMDPRRDDLSRQETQSSARREPFAGTAEERDPERDAPPGAPRSPGGAEEDELEAQAAADFFHDKPAATSARVFDPDGSAPE